MLKLNYTTMLYLSNIVLMDNNNLVPIVMDRNDKKVMKKRLGMTPF